MSARLAALLAAVAIAAAAPASASPVGDVENNPVWRAQLTVKVCPLPKWNAGTGDDVRVMLNAVNSTWLRGSHSRIKVGSELTYDLDLRGVSTFADVTQIRLSKTGTDGLCLKTIALHLNGARVFTKTYTSGKWLDGAVLIIDAVELRGGAGWLNTQ